MMLPPESIKTLLLMILCMVVIGLIVMTLVWRITCFFKKTCYCWDCPCKPDILKITSLDSPEKGCKKYVFSQIEVEFHNTIMELKKKEQQTKKDG